MKKKLKHNAVITGASRTGVALIETKEPEVCILALARHQMQASHRETWNLASLAKGISWRVNQLLSASSLGHGVREMAMGVPLYGVSLYLFIYLMWHATFYPISKLKVFIPFFFPITEP